jgi:hypothetical protein
MLREKCPPGKILFFGIFSFQSLPSAGKGFAEYLKNSTWKNHFAEKNLMCGHCQMCLGICRVLQTLDKATMYNEDIRTLKNLFGSKRLKIIHPPFSP